MSKVGWLWFAQSQITCYFTITRENIAYLLSTLYHPYRNTQSWMIMICTITDYMLFYYNIKHKKNLVGSFINDRRMIEIDWPGQPSCPRTEVHNQTVRNQNNGRHLASRKTSGWSSKLRLWAIVPGVNRHGALVSRHKQVEPFLRLSRLIVLRKL